MDTGIILTATESWDKRIALAGQSVSHNIHSKRGVMSQANRAFTLIELLVVISIIGILAALMLPGIKAVRDLAKSSVCQNNLRGAGVALLTYASDNEGLLPWGEAAPSPSPYSWVSAIGSMSDIETVRLTCPTASVQGGTYHFTANLQTLPCRTFGNFKSTLKPVRLAEMTGPKVLLFDAGLGQSPNGMNAFLTSMNMGTETFYFLDNRTDNEKPVNKGSNGGFKVYNRHSNGSKANYLMSDGRSVGRQPDELVYGDYRIFARGRRYF
jgi:prepilin-type N-terminal cleavage/methylation domain-containing protein/prepilin-type processing-associated H-X9-DG protein